MSPPFQVEHATRASRIGTAVLAGVFVMLAAAPAFAGRDDLRLLSEIFAYIALASLWNLLAGYAGLVSVGQQAYVELGGYVLFASTILAGLHPFAAVALAGVVSAAVALPVAGLLFRLRGHYFAIGTWVVAEVFRLVAAQISPLGGGSGISLPARIVTSMAPNSANARIRNVLDRVCPCPRRAWRHRAAVALALWTRAHGHPGQRARRPFKWGRCLAHQAGRICPHRIRDRHDRRTHFPAEASYLAGDGIQRQRLDCLRHLHHRHRRHRPRGGTDHRHIGVFPAAPDAGRSRQHLPAYARGGRHHRHAVCAKRHLGLCCRTLWLAVSPAERRLRFPAVARTT